jgi:hypothetical protein
MVALRSITIKSVIKSLVILAVIMNLAACVVRGYPDSHSLPRSHGTLSIWYYYPNAQVYYHPTEHYYYYSEGRSWRRANRLPSGLIINNDSRVRIQLSGDPYREHHNHRRQYPGTRPNHNRPRQDHREHHDRSNRRENHGRHEERHDRSGRHVERERHDDRESRRHNHGDNRDNHVGDRAGHRHSNDGRRNDGKGDKTNMFAPHTKEHSASDHNRANDRKQPLKRGPKYIKRSNEQDWKSKAKQVKENEKDHVKRKHKDEDGDKDKRHKRKLDESDREKSRLKDKDSFRWMRGN